MQEALASIHMFCTVEIMCIYISICSYIPSLKFSKAAEANVQMCPSHAESELQLTAGGTPGQHVYVRLVKAQSRFVHL